MGWESAGQSAATRGFGAVPTAYTMSWSSPSDKQAQTE